jgi:hypothetical protein
MLLVCSVMGTRPVWEQGESTQLVVMSCGIRLEGHVSLLQIYLVMMPVPLFPL